MKIAQASSLLANYQIRQDVSKSLLAGQEVLVTISDHHSELTATPPHSPELTQAIAAGQSAITAIRVNPTLPKDWNGNAMAFGGVTGIVVGASVGVLLNQLRSVHPASAIAVDAACAAIGLSAGAATGAAIGSGMFESVEVQPTITADGKFGLKLGAKFR
jgi:hypothetical protein